MVVDETEVNFLGRHPLFKAVSQAGLRNAMGAGVRENFERRKVPRRDSFTLSY